MESIYRFMNTETNFYYHQEGIRKAMCSGCPHKHGIVNNELDEEDYDFLGEGHAHVCHTDNGKGVRNSCKGVCHKAEMAGYQLVDERDLNATN